jgi:hypothetical protein
VPPLLRRNPAGVIRNRHSGAVWLGRAFGQWYTTGRITAHVVTGRPPVNGGAVYVPAQAIRRILAGVDGSVRRHAVTAWAAGTPDERVATRLIHTHCHRRTIGNGKDPALLPTRESSGVA